MNTDKLEGILIGFAFCLILSGVVSYWVYLETFNNVKIYESEIQGYVYYYSPIPMAPFFLLIAFFIFVLMLIVIVKTVKEKPTLPNET